MRSSIFLQFISKVYIELSFISDCTANYGLKSKAYFASNDIFFQQIQDAINIQIVTHITVVTTIGRFVPKDNATVEVSSLTLEIATHVPCIGVELV